MKERSPELFINEEREPLQDACGIVGILATNDGAFFDIGLDALTQLQTRGYDGAGFTGLRSDGSVLLHKEEGTVREVFKPGIVERLKSNHFYHGQLQVRYGTSGEFSPDNVQPFITRHKPTNDILVVSHNGQFSKKMGPDFSYKSDSVQFVEKLANSEGDNWDDRISSTLAAEKGAWSLIIGTNDCMYLARDPLGIRPLYFSQKLTENGEQVSVAASETEALRNVGFENYCEVLPGQIVKIERHINGYSATQICERRTSAHCMFENVYTLEENGKALLRRETSSEVNKSPTVAEVRRKCGEQLAAEAPLTIDEVDVVIGIPGTAITGGIAYANSLGLPYKQAITDKNTPAFEQRTFMQAQLEEIMQKVQRHFNFDADQLVGKRVALVDDSIVRGNISQGITKLLKQVYGVKEVHFRILCPPIDKPCFLGINTRTQSELIASQFANESLNYDELIDRIRVKICADSLAYLSSEGLLRAVAGSPNATGFCMGCMVGRKHPIDQYGQVQ